MLALVHYTCLMTFFSGMSFPVEEPLILSNKESLYIGALLWTDELIMLLISFPHPLAVIWGVQLLTFRTEVSAHISLMY